MRDREKYKMKTVSYVLYHQIFRTAGVKKNLLETQKKYEDENCPKAGLHAILITIELLWGTGLNALLCNYEKPPLKMSFIYITSTNTSLSKNFEFRAHFGIKIASISFIEIQQNIKTL